MRRPGLSGVVILRGFVAVLALYAPARAFAVEQLYLDVGIRHAQYLHLSEPYRFNPVAALAVLTSEGWERQWQDDRVWLEAGCEVRVGGHFLLQPGLALGAAQGQFAARNAGVNTFEEWRTKPGLLAGLSLAGEFRADPARGPFLLMQYLISRAEAGEAHETAISEKASNPDDRDAYFRWQESEAILGIGWRWGAFRPVAGVAHTDFSLKKWVRYHIPEAGLSDFDQQVVRALNGAQSEYHFENRHPWAPFLELDWQFAPKWTLAARARFSGSDGYSVGLLLGFAR